MLRLNEEVLAQSIQDLGEFRTAGELLSVAGAITASVPAAVGELCEIHPAQGPPCLAEVIGFRDRQVQIMPFGSQVNLRRGDEVCSLAEVMGVPVGYGLLGRVLNAIGQPIDGLGPLQISRRVPVNPRPPSPLSRIPVDRVFTTGVRAIDTMLTIGCGQRVGLFAGSGVGKSTLLGQIARHATADLNVVALIGERGREVLPFIKQSLGQDGMQKSVLIVSSADESPLSRVRAGESAVAMADWFRAQGNDVLLLMDSLTRLAMAQRDLGLMLNEPPTARGYTPSVFHKMAVLLEQLGNSDQGSITGVISILIDSDDMNDPVGDAARAILDGHIVLTRKLANAGHYPAIDVPASNSRLFLQLADNQHQIGSLIVRKILANYADVVDLLQIGAYQPGHSAETDRAIKLCPAVKAFLQQSLDSPCSLDESKRQLDEIARKWQTG